MTKILQIIKKDGSLVPFDQQKLATSIEKALTEARIKNPTIAAKKNSQEIITILEKNFTKDVIPSAEDLRDLVIEVLEKHKLPTAAKAFAEFKQREKTMIGFKTFMGVRDDIGMTPNALKVLAKRYLLRNEQGNIIETPSRLFRRVAKAIASIDGRYQKGSIAKTEETFYTTLSNLEFIPNTPTLMNAGTPLGQLAACFVLPVKDSLKEIFDTIEKMAVIHQCLVPETLVMTQQGLTTLGAVKNKDIIETDEGSFLVESVHENGLKQTFTLRTTHGYSVTGTSEHRFLAVSDKGKLVWKTMHELHKDDWLALSPGKWSGSNINLPRFIFKPRQGGNKTSYTPQIYTLPTVLTPELSELIGLYLGDGSNHRDGIRITVSDKEKDLIDRILLLTDKLFSRHVTISRQKQGTYEVSILSRQIKEWWTFIGAQKQDSNHATIPSILLSTTEENICAFLRGLFSTDGCIRVSGHITYTSASHKLIAELQTVLLHLGIPTREYQNKMTKIYQLSICSKEGFITFKQKIGFSSAFKQERLLKVLPKNIFKDGKRIPHQKFIVKEWFTNLSSDEKTILKPHLADIMYRNNRELFTQKLAQLQTSKKYSELLSEIINLEFFYTQVSSISPAGVQNVIDLTIPFKHAYIANGFISHNSGGGTGFNFSNLRPRGDIVRSTHGVASGPVSFMTVFDKATDVVKQGGKRRGANMAILNADHPDILEFVTAKTKEGVLTNFNISVAASDAFIDAADKNKEYSLLNPRTHKEIKKANAHEIFDTIVTAAWQTGDPGMVFIDEINRKNPTPHIGKIESTNPCGEMPLLPYESCTLGSINLMKMVKNGKVDWDKLKKTIRTAVHFLDNVIDANNYSFPEIEQITKANRKIGLGIMGFAELLIKLGILYNSDKALETAERLMKFICDESHKKSQELGSERGSFPNFKGSIWDTNKNKTMRNATTTTIAPTGTISLIAGVSSGIEPLFAISFVRDVMEGTKLLEVTPLFEELARKRGFYSKALMLKLARKGSVQDLKEVPSDIRKLFVTSFDVTPEWHVKLQATFQKYTDNAVSKTVNLPYKAKTEDVKKIYFLAHKLKCKGITVYRTGSKPQQVLYVPKPDEIISVEEEFSGTCSSGNCST